ncbi:MAG: phage minor head protein [Pseudomonadota bacterium]
MTASGLEPGQCQRRLEERLAFELYMRYGHRLPRKHEAKRQTGQYVWRTRGDDRVRSSHAANDGRLFSYDDPPPTGHPGEDYGCRCTAELFIPGQTEFLNHTLQGIDVEEGPRWGILDFVQHFYRGRGRQKTLKEIGHLREVAEQHGNRDNGDGALARISRVIIDQARRQAGAGSLSYKGANVYGFSSVSYVHGRSTVTYDFSITVRSVGGMMLIEGLAEYSFSDVLTDPLDLREEASGSSAPSHDQDVQARTDVGGTAYNIVGDWSSVLTANIHLDIGRSRYG